MIRAAITIGFMFCAALPAIAQPLDDAGSSCRVDPGSFVISAADLAGVDADLLAAIAWVESHNCDRAVSPAGAAGLMQLMPETAAGYGVADPFDPAQSALGAARFLPNFGAPFGLFQWRRFSPPTTPAPQAVRLVQLADCRGRPGAAQKPRGEPRDVAAMAEYSARLSDDRLAHPGNDVISILVHSQTPEGGYE
jgi:soluble lytic murein transglycosylase-like protein